MAAAREWPPKGLEQFSQFVEGIDGFPGAYSEYGQAYASIGFETEYEFNYSGFNSQYDLEARFMQVLLKCRQRGGALIVWRQHPELTIENNKHRIYARFHCLPTVAFDDEDMKPEGEPFRQIKPQLTD